MTKPFVLTVSSNKGGAGKTTTAVHLAAGLALDGEQVLLVDLDKQGHCATFLGRDPAPRLFDLLVKERPLAEMIVEVRPRLHLLISNPETLVAQDFARLRNAQADLLENSICPGARSATTTCAGFCKTGVTRYDLQASVDAEPWGRREQAIRTLRTAKGVVGANERIVRLLNWPGL
jgi:hypothetical protein